MSGRYEERYAEEDVISPTSAFREVMVSTHTSNFGYGNEYGAGAIAAALVGAVNGGKDETEEVKLNGTSLVMDTSEDNSIRGGGKERKGVSSRTKEVNAKTYRYRPAYELKDGSLERCGRGMVQMLVPETGKK